MNHSTKDIIIGVLLILVVVLLVLLVKYLPVSERSFGNREIVNVAKIPKEKIKGMGRAKKDPYEKIQIKNTVTKNNFQIQKCYLELLGHNPQIKHGQVTLDWQIDQEGKAQKVEIVNSDFQDKNFETCIRDSIALWRFPPPPPNIPIPYYTYFKFNFKMEENSPK